MITGQVKFQSSKRMRAVPLGGHIVWIMRSLITAFLGGVALINLAALLFNLTDLPISHLAATLMSVYLIVELRILLHKADLFSLLSPSILSVIFHFVFSYLVGITSAVLEPTIMTRFGEWVPDLDRKLALTIILALTAVFFMLRGSALGQPLARRLRAKLQRMPSLRRDMRPKVSVILGLQVIYVMAVGYSISLGTFGLLATQEGIQKNIQQVQVISTILAAGSMGYFLLANYYFQQRQNYKHSHLMTFFVLNITILHILFGALSGYKYQMVFPFLAITLASFLAKKKLDLKFILLIGFALYISYGVVEPFRGYLGDQSEAPQSVSEAVNALNRSVQSREQFSTEENSVEQQIAERLDLAGMTTAAIDYVQQGDLHEDERRKFKESLALAPVLAYVPRAIWLNKPSYADIGVWFNQVVLGRRFDALTSVSMGPIGYLYFAGGAVAVIIGFIGWGMMQALIFDGVARAGAGGLVVYLSVASTLVLIPPAVGPSISGLLTLLPFAFAAQMFFLRKDPGAGISTAAYRSRQLEGSLGSTTL